MRRDEAGAVGRRWAGRAAALVALVGGLVLAGSPTTTSLTPASAAPASAPAGTTKVDLVQDGTPAGRVVRPYLLTVPTSGRGARPLVLVLHGRYQTIESLRSVTGIEQVGEKAGFVSVFPSGYGAVWNAGTCCDSRKTPDMPDVSYLDDVVRDAAQRTPVDPRRVYVLGFSNGGMMAYRYACQRSSTVAGVGVVSGAMAASPDYADQGPRVCRPDAPVSVIDVHGSKDTTVPYEGGTVAGGQGETVAPVRGGVDQSAVAAGCTSGTSTRVGATVRLDYTDCESGAAVRLVKVQGHAHGWTRDSRKYGYDTTVGIWGFLKDRRAVTGG